MLLAIIFKVGVQRTNALTTNFCTIPPAIIIQTHIMLIGVQTTNALGTNFLNQGAQRFHALSRSSYDVFGHSYIEAITGWSVDNEHTRNSKLLWGIMLGVVHDGMDPPHPLKGLSANTQRTWNKFFCKLPTGLRDTMFGDIIQTCIMHPFKARLECKWWTHLKQKLSIVPCLEVFIVRTNGH